MSDGVSALFAKKKDKKQKKNVVKMDDVGQVLERRAKKQLENGDNEEERVAAEAEEEKRAAEDEAFLKKAAQEESDWIDYNDQNLGRLEGLKIKDMGADSTEEEESEHVDDLQQRDQEIQQKGWGNVNKTEDEDLMPTASEMAAARHHPAGKYVPPTQRGHRSTANIDINNEEMFPTIGAAAEVEKNHKEDKKNPWGTRPTESVSGGGGGGGYVPPFRRGEGAASGGGGASWGANISAQRDAALAAARAMAATTSPSPAAQPKPPVAAPEPTPTPTAAPASTAPEAPKKAAYVPPHLRNRT